VNPQPLQHEQPLALDTPCARCRYNLRGLGPAGRCPECGASVLESHDLLLRNADPAWVRRLARGSTRLFLVISLAAFSPIMPIAAYLCEEFVGLTMQSGWDVAAGSAVRIFYVWWLAAWTVLAVCDLTSDQPGKPNIRVPSRPTDARQALWIASVCAAVAILCYESLHLQQFETRIELWLILVITMTGAVGIITLFIGVAAAARHMQWLALRIPDDALRTSTKQVAFIIQYGGPAAVVLIAVPTTIGAILGPWNALAQVMWVVAPILILCAMVVACGVWFLSMQFMRRFRRLVCELDEPASTSNVVVSQPSGPTGRILQHETPTGAGAQSDSATDGPPTPDVPCRACGRSLLGLAHDAVCPECGLRVCFSADLLLIRADPAWVRRLARGSTLLVAAILMLLVTPLALMAIAFLTVFIGRQRFSASVISMAVIGYPVLLGLIAARAMTELTAREHHDEIPPSTWSAPVVARRLVMAAALCLPVALALCAPCLELAPAREEFESMILGLTLSAYAVALTGGILLWLASAATCVHLSRLAARIPDAKLESRFRLLARILIGSAASAFALLLIRVVMPEFLGDNPLFQWAGVPALVIVGLTVLIGAVGALILSIAFTRRLRKLERELDDVAHAANTGVSSSSL
jgi:uncharacterized protein YoxC